MGSRGFVCVLYWAFAERKSYTRVYKGFIDFCRRFTGGSYFLDSVYKVREFYGGFF